MTISSIRLAPRRATLSVIAKAGVLILLAVSFGCANGEIRPGDPFDREQELEEAQHRYTVLMRWSQFQKAQKFVARKERGAFLERMEVLEDARFTDYESDEIDISEDLDSATVRVKYTLYLANSPYEIEIAETQDWSRDGMSNNWRVVSNFDALPKTASN